MNKMNLIGLLMQDPEAVAALEQAFASRNQTPGMGSTANAGMSAPGMAGTPGGPVQESPTMDAMRWLQFLGSYPTAAIGGTAGGQVAGYPGFAAGIAPGVAMNINSSTPNIRDVWTDKLRMKMQGN